MNELISIIIPVFNVAQYLDRCLKSVTRQTYKNLEIVIIDDGSTDNSGRICDEWALTDSRIRVLHKTNEGVARARNDALKIAMGDYIGFVDPDDWIEKNMFEVLLVALRKYSADIVICGFEEVENDIKKDKIPKGLRVYNRQEALYELILDQNVRSYCWDKLFRKECMVDNPFPAVKRISDLGGIHKFFQKANTVLQLNERLYHRIRRKNGLVTVDGPLETRTDYCIAQQYRYEDLLFEEEKLRTAIQEQYVTALESMQRSFYTNEKTTGNNIEDCLFKIDNIILPFYLTHIEDLRKLTKFTVEKENELTLFLNNPMQSSSEDNHEIPIVMAADDNYAYPMFVSLASVFASANENTIYNAHLLLNKNFSVTNFERLTILQKSFARHKVEIHVMDKKFDDININIDHIKTATFYRLELPKLLPNVNKCIYLDVDTIVNRDLSELFRLNIDDNYMAGVRAAGYYYPEDKAREHSNRLGIVNIFSYVNAGVLLMNLKNMRKDSLMDVFNELIQKDFPSMDQDILNSACYGKIRILHPKYNSMTKYSLKDDKAYQSMKHLQLAYTLEEWDSARKQPVIIHYADIIKPWDDLSVDYADKWWRVATELPFFKEIYQHYYEQIINSANMMKLNCQNLNNELKAEKLFQGFVEKKQLQKYVTARIDFKNYGLNNNDVVVTEFSDIDAKIQKPAWFKNEKGQGCVTESSKGSMALEMKCIGDGELKIFLRGMDCRDNNNNRIPIWINYTSLFVNDQCIFKESKLVWHDKPFVYKLNVTDGQRVIVHLEWEEALDFNAKERETLLKRVDQAQKKVIDLEKVKQENAKLERELKNVKNGWSFKIGRVITWLPRRIKK